MSVLFYKRRDNKYRIISGRKFDLYLTGKHGRMNVINITKIVEVIMEKADKVNIESAILDVINRMESDEAGWVNLARMGAPLVEIGVNYKKLGFPKLKQFLDEFENVLEFSEEQEGDNPPVYFVRPRGDATQTNNHAEQLRKSDFVHVPVGVEKIPTRDSWLFSWATIPAKQIKALADLALEEKWYYGERDLQEQEELPILRNYLAYTFKRLCFEGKIVIKNHPERNEEYAAFNTGLVDRKYEYIYALFKRNTLYEGAYWYLVAFVVPGEDIGKTLVDVFNPLPERANYFENKIENMLYDTTTGELSCDYTHILSERVYRLPLEFLIENCPNDFLCIDGVNIEDIYDKPLDEDKKEYFRQLGIKIKGNARVLNRLKNRLEDAVDLALKRVEWNYKTAIPMYYPTKNQGSLLLPLALVDEEHVDLALVVERKLSGAYQGQTILPLSMAYSNSRLVTRPDSDWLKTDVIVSGGSDKEDEE